MRSGGRRPTARRSASAPQARVPRGAPRAGRRRAGPPARSAPAAQRPGRRRLPPRLRLGRRDHAVVCEVGVGVEGHHADDARTVAIIDERADPPVRRRCAGALHDDVIVPSRRTRTPRALVQSAAQPRRSCSAAQPEWHGSRHTAAPQRSHRPPCVSGEPRAELNQYGGSVGVPSLGRGRRWLARTPVLPDVE